MPAIDPQPNSEEKQQKLEQDFDKPFSPPAGVTENSVEPPTNTNIDSQQVYDEGAANAAEFTEPQNNILDVEGKVG